MKLSDIYLAGGCFWGTQHFVEMISGVISTEVGYANGHTEDPTYAQVCKNDTGFAETVHVIYNRSLVSLERILSLFYKIIDPTSINRQGEDSGTQYRTGIYYVNDSDRNIINQSIAELQKNYIDPVVIEVEPLRNFYKAEYYHQEYLNNNPGGYCHIAPELFALAKEQ